MRPERVREFVDFVSGRLPRLHRTAYLLCGDRHLAEDIVQSTLTALFVQWKRNTTIENADGYLQRILVRRYLDERRRRWFGVLLGDRLPDTPARPQAAVEERDALMTALRTLPNKQRAAIVLRYYDDLSVEQTAELLRCSPSTVKSQCSRGLIALREVLQTEMRVQS
ncbi:SigE family RNA polymerase sigma factor [Actinoplanes couchii]|uniref:RNA polymerase sigma24 factor n=1 Tax=Actinoplanes couchii TaxID=403638 RepID=A0ABQ3XR30_9ACTN|nr:SigE family RNA polymerase sigma factor [Actinoplanes couchii]MDR6318179.1 RNA polymerase sigma-70 factor (sigma-E family) [Actinoplanes couchii]GID60973.1 RNA polymerase sigma24 factor [Actinoplanes couchii]